MTFAYFVRSATGDRNPYPYQSRLAELGLPDVLRVPTGAGKTLAAVLPWLYRRTAHPDAAVRSTTPRWLVVVLPQRTLVEQTVDAAREWVRNLGVDVPVHMLMGGESFDDNDWTAHPERERIFAGTQDMVLSRLLMRGFAEHPARWPVSFGLLNAGVQFVFDEVQLMGPSRPTSLQLQGFRELLGTALPCRSMWMSAALDPHELSTVDFRRELTVAELDDADRSDGRLRTRLDATRTVRRLDIGEPDRRRYPQALAEHILAAHRPGTRTLVVVNVVDRAVEVYNALAKAGPDTQLVLLHSRFRPGDRRRQTDLALTPPRGAGTIVVATQVLEAGVDVTSDTLVTETAPWSSIVQRAGRCNRDGAARDARLLWTPPPPGPEQPLPYDAAELEHTAAVLSAFDGRAVTGSDLAGAAQELTRPLHPVLRRRDLLDLFDTAPDLSGNDIDVSPFIRDATDRTVPVAWRLMPDADETAPGRDELCPAPIGQVRKLITNGLTRARILDHTTWQWRPARPEDVRPSAVIVLDATLGGYLPERGFAPRSSAPVDPVGVSAAPPDAVDTDPQSARSTWVPLQQHLADVEREAGAVLDALAPDLTATQQEAVALAGRYHDLGKAHPTFLQSLEKANAEHPPPATGGPWAKSPSRAPLRHDPKYFRHELVSALLLLDPGTGLLDGVAEPDLVVYLALAHHGEARLTVRGRPDEPPNTILGVVDGYPTADLVLPDGSALPARPVSLDPVRLGQGSLTDRALRLRDRADLGPFRLAFCEAVVRCADWRASASYDMTTGERR